MKIDLLIIGAGPAGLTAAIYAKRAGLEAVLVEKEGCGGQMAQTYEIDNYPGLPGISGMELGERMKEHAQSLGINIVYDEITSFIGRDGGYSVVMAGGEEYETRGIIIASGATHSKLNVPGEEDFAFVVYVWAVGAIVWSWLCCVLRIFVF